MSVAIHRAVDKYSKQKGNHRFLMYMLADEADDNGENFSGIPHLALKLNVDERTIQRLTRNLIKADELAVIWRGYQGSTEEGKKKYAKNTNLYFILCGLSPEDIREVKAYCDAKNAANEPAKAILAAGKRGPEAKKRRQIEKSDGDNLSPSSKNNGDTITSPVLDVMVTDLANTGDTVTPPNGLIEKSLLKESTERYSELPSTEQTPIAADPKAREWLEMSKIQLRAEMSFPDYRTFIKGLWLIGRCGENGEILMIGVDNAHNRGWLASRLNNRFNHLLECISMLQGARVEFILAQLPEGHPDLMPGPPAISALRTDERRPVVLRREEWNPP